MDKKDISKATASQANQGLTPCFKTPIGYNDNTYLGKLCREGLLRRYGIKDVTKPKGAREKTVIDRLNSELKLIEQTCLASQFLIVWDIVTVNRKKNVYIGPGHGAEAGSLVCYLIGISDIDPFKYRLFMERFVNPERLYMLSFILNSCKDGHYAIIDYVKDKYGRDKTASLFTAYDRDLITTIRDIGNAQRVPAKKINHILSIIQEATADYSQFSPQKLKALYHELSSNPAAKNIMDSVYIIEELCRGSGFDFSYIVIGNEPLHKKIPVGITHTGDLIALSKSVEFMGFINLYIGGSKFLTTINRILQILKNKGVRLNIELIPLNDPETFKVINNENAFGVFQYENDWNNLVSRISPDRFELLFPCAALGLPGPARFSDKYIARKTGKIKIHYDHPLLEPILSETYGMFIYQEQLMEAVHMLAGYTLGQGDLFRRILYKKHSDDIQQQRTKFIAGCRQTNNIPGRTANKLFNNMYKIAGYLYNKAHAVCCSTIAYQMAYLKAHYPQEFKQAEEIDKIA